MASTRPHECISPKLPVWSVQIPSDSQTTKQLHNPFMQHPISHHPSLVQDRPSRVWACNPHPWKSFPIRGRILETKNFSFSCSFGCRRLRIAHSGLSGTLAPFFGTRLITIFSPPPSTSSQQFQPVISVFSASKATLKVCLT